MVGPKMSAGPLEGAEPSCPPPTSHGPGGFHPELIPFQGSVIPRVHFRAGFCQALCPWQVIEPLGPLGSSPTEGQRPSWCHCTYCCRRVSHLGLLLALSQDTGPERRSETPESDKTTSGSSIIPHQLCDLGEVPSLPSSPLKQG